MQLWEQQPNEGDRAFAAARRYFKIGIDRSLEKVSQGLGKSKAIVERWSARHNWVIRARAFDAYLNNLELDMMESEVKDSARKWAARRVELLELEWAVRGELLERAEAMLKFPLARQTVSQDGQTIIIEPSRWHAGTILQYFELASRLGRLSVGEVTARMAANVSSQVKAEKETELDYSKLTEDELEQLLDIWAKAGGTDLRL